MPALRHQHAPTTPPKDRFILKPGERCSVRSECGHYDLEYEQFVHRGGRFFAVGPVEYCGDDGIKRITGFCREYSAATGMWTRIENSEYEYAY